TANDKPILLYVNEENLIIDGAEIGGISLIKCKNIEIRNLQISNNTVGMGMSYCSKIKVINNVISNTGRGGIYVHHSNNCIFKYNTFINDNWGIFLRKSNFNKMHYNNFINVTMPDWFAGSYFNSWDSNYWGESISGHRKIFGKIGFFEKIPWYNFDQNPADEPNLLYANEKTIYVDDDGGADYKKIQNAIDNASECDTVFVYNGTYYENLIVNKKIDLIGEDKHTTIIDGMLNGDTIAINAEGVMLSNFTITHGTTNIKNDIARAGIRVTKSNNNIKNNIIKDNMLGVFGLRVTNLTVCNNRFYDDGITFSPYENEARPKICMKYFLHNIYNNTVNDKPLYYYKNQKDFAVPKDAGMIILTNCTNVTITDVNLTYSDDGLLMAYSSNCLIEHSNISNGDGIWTFCSSQNIFQFNTLSNNFHGITLDYNSNYNIIQNNTISNNEMAGVMIEYYSTNNHITKNNLINKTYGGYFTQAFRNKWDQNYYSDWIGLKYNKMTCLPKIILGRFLDLYPKISICFKIDWYPAETPYN
ncbi:MAG: right-handed parallel beta-helix repeat-containing protein, partial [Candidatus Thermoplasmatota archaeon]|nr:right-handed parallel beta-helix repeat-containing protein [Candidatus Thermoplasmatota archaeon]